MKTINTLLITLAALLFANVSSLHCEVDSWSPFQSLSGKCSLSFPQMPEHIVNKMQIPNSDEAIFYHIYLSSPENANGVYLLVVAKYPAPIESSEELLCLEGFLTGIIQQNPQNKLISAEMTEVFGHQAVDFNVQSSEKVFKGRTLVARDTLYLIAVENALEKFDEVNFEKFITSFSLIQE